MRTKREAKKLRMGVPSSKFPDGNFFRAGARGFCLSGVALKQKHRSALRLPIAHQAVGALPS